MIEWSDEQLEAAGIDKKALQSLVRRLERCSKDMARMGLHLYGASGSGCLIHESRPTHIWTGRGSSGQKADQGSVVADVGLGFDGGDW
jgi:hypothetical protein